MKKKRLSLILVIIITLFLIYSFSRMDFTDRSDDGTREVKLYFSTSDARYLQAENRKLEEDNIYISVIDELIKGPETYGLGETIPEGVYVLGFELEDGLARIDFNRALVDNHWGGSTGETFTVYSIVNTLTQFEEINQVLILVSGEKIETLAGHMYMLEPLERNEEIIKDD